MTEFKQIFRVTWAESPLGTQKLTYYFKKIDNIKDMGDLAFDSNFDVSVLSVCTNSLEYQEAERWEEIFRVV
jgi:hypothetical protein